jgi:HK97 family phage major capsid protein
MTLKERLEWLDAKRAAIQAVFTEAGPDMDFSKVKSLEGDTKAKVEKLQAMTKELDEGKAEYDALKKLDTDAKRIAGWDTTVGKQADGKVEEKPKFKSLGEAFIESKAGSELKGRAVDVPGIDVKTLMQASAGWDPENVRSGRVELYAQQALGVLDYIPMGTCSGDMYKYMKETTFTNNAAETSEGGVYGEAALAYTETSDEVEKVAVWLPITDEQLEDNLGLASLINQRLTYMLKARVESQVLTGDGISPNLWGALNLSSVQSQAKGTYSTPDALHMGITKVRATGFAEPSVVFMHPNDWQGVRLLTTADGIYIFGSPNDAGVQRIWGVPVCVTTFETENTAMVGAFASHSMLFIRRGIQFKVSDSHDTYFIYGKQAIRCDMRAAMVYFRDTAFCKVTGI